MITDKALLTKKFGIVKETGRPDQFSVNCIFCTLHGLTPNTTYKLSINTTIKKYHCFRCGTSGRLEDLIPQASAIKYTTYDTIEKGLEPLPEVESLEDLISPWNKLVYNFLHGKGFAPVTMKDICYFCESYIKKNFDFGPRLIFPIYQSGKYKGFQARTIYNNTDPKYTGATGMQKSKILYNYDIAFSQNERLVITEGFFDCLKVGQTAVCTLGKIVTEGQIRLIKLKDFKKVILFLDKDAYAENKENANKLKRYFKTYIACPKWETLPLLPNGRKKKDPGDLTRQEINEVLNFNLERVF